MKKKIKKSAGAKANAAAASKVTANARLVAAIRASDDALNKARSVLVVMAEICQSEDLTRPEVVASIMEARGVEKSTAESQYSRMKKLMTDPATLAALKDGSMSLTMARAASKKAQKSPSPEKKKANAEKKFAKALSTIVETAKETGMDYVSVLKAIKSALKKAGLKAE